MKKIYYLILTVMFLGAISCTDYLDINDNPNNPNETLASPDQRLLAIISEFVDAYESSGTRGSWITQDITKTTGTANNDLIMKWRPVIGSTTWPYQAWFVYCASNFKPLFEKATGEEAWHYVGAGKIIYAWGFMTMLDLYGEMPMSDALGASLNPVYDDGKTMFYQCLDILDEGIEYLQRTQSSTAVNLKNGDFWFDGDVNKWIKLAHSLKARWLNNLSKKSIYDADEILDELSKAMLNNDESCVHVYQDWGDAKYDGYRALQHQNVSGTGQRMTKWKLNLLTNDFTGGSGVQDPRTTRMMPSAEFNIGGTWTMQLTEGVDMINGGTSAIRNQSGPVAFYIYGKNTSTPWGNSFTPDGDGFTKDLWSTASLLTYRWGDSIYLSPYSETKTWNKENVMASNDHYNSINYYNTKVNHVMSTGTFYTRADSPGHLICYPEMCFIKAEALFRKGDKGGALIAYKDGIRAHMELMNKRLSTWPQDYGKETITATEISNFLASAAVAQTAGDLTMAKIMMQKHIALSFSLQNWNDMRRFDYSKNWGGDIGVVYTDFDRPAEFDGQSALVCIGTAKTDPRYWIRRLQHCSHEVNYNIINLKASNKEALELSINSIPVWWDCATDDEYYGYIR